MSCMVLILIHMLMIPQILLESVLIPSFCKLLGLLNMLQAQNCKNMTILSSHNYTLS